MKQRLNKIVLIMLASIVFFVGAGVTVFDFCCSGCINDFISLEDSSNSTMLCYESAPPSKESDSCCMEMQASDDTSACNADSEQKSDKHCSVERISTDIEHSHIHTQQLTVPFVWFVLAYKSAETKLANISSDKAEENYKLLIPKLPREYLSLIRVLII